LEQVKKFCSLNQLTPEVVDIYQILWAGINENKTQINIGCIEKENRKRARSSVLNNKQMGQVQFNITHPEEETMECTC
jgi:hypothetical protein